MIVMAGTAVLLLSACSDAGRGETVREAAERILDQDAEVREWASISGPVEVVDAVSNGECAVAYFIETRGPYDLSLVMRDDDGWKPLDVVTGHGVEPNPDLEDCWQA